MREGLGGRGSGALALAIGLLGIGGSMPAVAQEESPLYQGGYGTVLGRYLKPDSAAALDDGFGATAGLGLRRGALAFEGRLSYTRYGSAQGLAAGANMLVFPFEQLPGLYGLFGAGLEHLRSYPGIGDVSFNNTSIEGGLGYLLPLRVGNYQFGIRTEALYEYAKRNKRAQDQAPPTVDLPVPSSFDNVIVHIGLQLPFGKLPPPPPPPPPVALVPPPPPPAPEPPPPPPECKKPLPGERLSLDGCGVGDALLLHGVNFEFDKTRLTPDAKTLLDNVVAELQSHAALHIEIDGHTDARGTDAYNQRLSEGRAAAVAAYLAEQGIDPARLSSKGFGESQPIADNASEQGREENRRVELKIVAVDP